MLVCYYGGFPQRGLKAVTCCGENNQVGTNDEEKREGTVVSLNKEE